MPARPRLRLAELIRPLGPSTFARDHWDAERPFVSHPALALVERLRALPVLASAPALLARHRLDVSLFGPRGFRSVAPAASALGFLEAGYNLYITGVLETAPELRPMLDQLARDLALHPWQLSLEVFVGKAGAISTRHYDHDINFQILLAGEKKWEVEQNRHIENPLFPYHGKPGETRPFRDEAFAADRVLPDGFDRSRSLILHAAAGSVLFLPRAWWHEVESLTDTFSLNVVIKGATQAEVFARGLYDLLLREPSFRAYYRSAAFARAPSRGAADLNGVPFQTLKARALRALAMLDEEDVAMSSLQARQLRWPPGTEQRHIADEDGRTLLRLPGGTFEPVELDGEARPIVEELARLRHPFTLAHARTVCQPASALAVQNMVSDLEAMGLLVADGAPKPF